MADGTAAAQTHGGRRGGIARQAHEAQDIHDERILPAARSVLTGCRSSALSDGSTGAPCFQQRGARWRRQRIHAPLPLPLVGFLLTVGLNGAGAEFQRVISSPDLAAVARAGSFSPLPLGHRERLKETPEERLKQHLAVLKAHGPITGKPTPTAAPSLLDPTRWHVAAPGAGIKTAGDEDANGPIRQQLDGHYTNGMGTEMPEIDPVWTPLDGHFKAGPVPVVDQLTNTTPDKLNPFFVRGSTYASSQRPRAERTADAASSFLQQYTTFKGSISTGTTTAICFDFDRTLSQEHVYQLARSSRASQVRGLTTEEAVAAFGGRRRIERLVAFLTDLTASGAAIHIVSLGHKAEIEATLARVGLSHLFPSHHVYGCEQLRQLRLVTKAQCTAHIAALYQLRRRDVLLVDDDHDELDECCEQSDTLHEAATQASAPGPPGTRAADEGTCGTYWVRSGRGLTEKDMAAIGGMARSKYAARHAAREPVQPPAPSSCASSSAGPAAAGYGLAA